MSPIRPEDEGISFPVSTRLRWSPRLDSELHQLPSPALATREWTSVADNDTKTNEYI